MAAGQEVHGNQRDGVGMTSAIAAINAIVAARRRLVHKYPFHARFAAQWALSELASIETVGVTIQAGTIHLLFNPAFVVSCSVAELGAVLLHEIHHLLFGHVWMAPADYPDRRALVIAQEVSANEFVREPFPIRPVLLADYPRLPPNEDTVKRYHRLASDCLSVKEPDTLDDHSQWMDASRSPTTSEAVIKVAVEATLSAMSADEVQQIDEQTFDAVADLVAGNTSGSAIERIERTRCSHRDLSWRRLLRDFVRQGCEPQPTFMRAPRRFPAMLGMVPGRLRRPNRASVMTILDTSGSIGVRELALIVSEIELIAATNDVIVVECDAAIRRVYPFTARLTMVQGRGGTDLRPPLESEFLAKHRPALAIYFTDGYGPAPSQRPRIPVLWCLTATGRRPATWGREVRLPR
jgi:predicted metal-dependent peptidase